MTTVGVVLDLASTTTLGDLMDETSIVTELRSAAADSRRLDARCEEIAALLLREGATPPFELGSADFAADPLLICADRYWRLRFLDHPTVSTAAECARWLFDHAHGEHRVDIEQKWSPGYAFITKDNVESKTDLVEATGRILDRYQGSEDICYFAAIYHAAKLRANFWFDELNQFLDSSLLAVAAGAHRQDPLFVALQSFAAFGSRAITTERARQLLDEAWSSPSRSRQVTDVCLNALSAAAPFDGHGELLRERAQEAVHNYPTDDIFRFRLATGQRMCEQYTTALDNIDAALRYLPAIGSRGSHKMLQEQYLHERSMIQEGLQRAAWTTQQQQRWERQAVANDEIQRTVQNSTIRAIELVTIFTAAIAFAVGSLQVTLSGTLRLGDRIWLLATLGTGLVVFALMIIGGTWLITRPHPARRTRHRDK